jgi:multiple sugar transport system permease protein
MSEKKAGEKGGLLTLERVICYIVLVFLCLLSLFAFYVLIINSTRSHADISKGFSVIPGKSFLANFRNVMNNRDIPVILGVRNSLIVSGCSAFLTVYFSALTAYAFHVYNFRYKNALFTFILAIMMVPTQVSSLGFVNLISRMHLMDNWFALIITSVASPAVFYFMKQYMESSLPLEIVEAARIDGSGEFHTFNQIVLPIMKPAMAVQAIFAFVFSWNNYFIPALIMKTNTKKTLPILIAQLRSADFLKFDMGQVYMMIFISIIPVMVVYFALSKFIVRGVAVGSVKG